MENEPILEGTTGAYQNLLSVENLRGRSVIFSALGDDEAKAFIKMARIVKHPARHTVFQIGEAGDNLQIVLRGRVKVSLISPGGKEVILSILQAGDIFGEMALFDGEPRSATVTTLEECVLLVIWRRDFLPFLESTPVVALKLLAALSSRLRATNELVGNLSFLGLSAHLARTLLNLVQNHGTVMPDGIAINLKLSQEELGNLIGVSRESVNRQIRHWVEAGIIDFSQGIILVKDSDALLRETLVS